MMEPFIRWLRKHYNKIISSIAFYPALIAVFFVLISWAMLELDFSQVGKDIKANWKWISLKDAETARTIISTIAAGILSLTVFSFSMVMIVMNQAASYMSNRVLDHLIRNRLQQFVLGTYLGTIVYALLLLSTIRDIDSGVHIPSLSVYLLIAFTVVDIFLFISFLHYITQSVKYETIIYRIFKKTLKSLKEETDKENNLPADQGGFDLEVQAPETGYYQGFDQKELLKYAEKWNIKIKFIYPVATHLLKGVPMLLIKGEEQIKEDCIEKLFLFIDFFNGQPIERNYLYGFRHLSEVGVKALSPGINDPSTAVLSLQALCELLAWRIHHKVPNAFHDSKGIVRIIGCEPSFEDLVNRYVYPIWDYGKKDRIVQDALKEMINQLIQINDKEENNEVLYRLREKVLKQIECRNV